MENKNDTIDQDKYDYDGEQSDSFSVKILGFMALVLLAGLIPIDWMIGKLKRTNKLKKSKKRE